ncbi:FkbM family methyltransferase [Streptomyces mesophilus]|uniref:FkbM family methyltransferase n=1 Tax=Streptomyces mesophilus TaxID=1775132 RepID=UPI003319FDBE
MATTVFRRLLEALPRLGVHVLDLEPGAAVISRRGRWQHAKFGGSGSHLLVRGDQDVADEREFQLAAAQYLCHHHVAGILERYGVNCVFDVGANRGQYAKRLRRSGYKGRIVSFEPVPLTFETLREAAKNDPDWQVHPCALGSAEGTSTIHVDWNTMNSLLPPSDYGRGRYKRFKKGGTEEITVRRLDGVIDEALDGIADPRPYLKMDTQGFDLQVFEGGGKRIDEFVGLQSEVAPLRLYEGSPAMAESIAAYEARGFGITGMYPVTREPATGRVVEFDCVMVRAEASTS